MRRFVDVESPAAYASPEASVLTRLFANLVTDYLNELAYPADLAGVFAVRHQALCLRALRQRIPSRLCRGHTVSQTDEVA